MTDKTITHKYIGGGSFYPGLPAVDVDATTLSPEQLAMLVEGIQRGMYEVVTLEPKKSKAIQQEAPAEILAKDTAAN